MSLVVVSLIVTQIKLLTSILTLHNGQVDLSSFTLTLIGFPQDGQIPSFLGVVLGTSSRAWGSVKRQNGVDIVQNDFRLITPTDIVYEPSTPDAIVTSIMENKEWILENGVLVEREIDQIQKLVNTSIRTKSYDEKELFNSIMGLVAKK